MRSFFYAGGFMKYIVTGDRMKEYDNNTIMRIGIPALELMENAAKALYEKVKGLDGVDKKILIVCGIGNNGGDGLALARLLTCEGYKVDVYIKGDVLKSTQSFREQLKRLEVFSACFINEEELENSNQDNYSIIVDALFGVGLSREITGEYADIIKKCNGLNGFKIAVDIPSGICANTGKVLGCAFKADCTVTFAFKKLGLCLYPGASYAGEIQVSDIGITEQAFKDNPPNIFTYEGNPLKYMPARKPDGNKGTFGKLLVIAGFDTMAGAAVLCSRAALESGTGMVKVLCSPENRYILQTSLPEVLYGTTDSIRESISWADNIVIGPGLGKSHEVQVVLKKVLNDCDMPIILDADALNLISESSYLKRLLKDYKGEKILTPHVGELARLSGFSIKDTKEHLLKVAKSIAMEYHSIVVAKDARTYVVREKGPVYLNTVGNSGMATAGSGDVLAGIIGSLICQGHMPFEAACSGVYLHGMAGDCARDVYTEYGVTASRLIENIRMFNNVMTRKEDLHGCS